MNTDPASLSNLQDIVLPDPVSFWPPGNGGLLILSCLVLGLAVLSLQFYLNRRRNRYRRAGLALLKEAATTQEVSIILKRVALAAFPREMVASLYGDAWIDFLNTTCPRIVFKPQFFDTLTDPPGEEMLRSARRWIAGHNSRLAERSGG